MAKEPTSLVAGSSRRDHEGMPKRLTVLAYALFGFAVLLAGVAVVGALLLGIDSETAWSSFLITNTVIGLSAAPCGLLDRSGQARQPDRLALPHRGRRPAADCGSDSTHDLRRRTRLAAVRAATPRDDLHVLVVLGGLSAASR